MRKSTRTFLFLLLVSPMLLAAATPKFTLYNTVRYRNAPANPNYLQALTLTSMSQLVAPYVATNPGPTDNLPNFPAIKALAQSTLPQPTVPLTFDIEVWPYSPTASLNTTIANLIAVVDTFKKVNPLTPVGYYGVIPNQAYQWSNIDPVNNPSGYSNWKSINTSMKSVAKKIDIFFPSFYAYDTDTVSWRKMVDSTVAVTKRYYTGKPIYAYIYPQYHQSSTSLSLTFIDTDRWMYQLEMLYKRIDGCVIWTSATAADGSTISWDPNGMAWWRKTKEFMVKKALVQPLVFDRWLVANSMPKVELQWTTSVDTISNYFVVQRSNDSINFTSISAHIARTGYNYYENNYSFTDTQTPTGKVYYRLQITDQKNSLSYSPVIGYSPAQSAFTSGNIAVLRIGGNNADGSNSGSPSSAGTAVHIDELNSSTGVLKQTIDLPIDTLGSNFPFYLSSSAVEGLLTLSPNGQFLTALGYSAKTSSSIYSNTPLVSPRTVAFVKSDGTINTTTALTDFSTSTVGSAITTNGTDIWLAATASNGIAYTTLGSTGGEMNVSSTIASSRSLGIFQNDLYYVSAAGNRIGTVAAGGGIPKTSGNTMTALNVNGTGISNAAPNQMLMLDINPSISGVDVMYITNAGSTNTTGILKYCKDASGIWQPYGGYGNTTTDSIYMGITGSASGSTVTLYFTTGIKTGNFPGKVVKMTDSSGYNGTMNGNVVWSVIAPANSTYRGVTFTPVPTSDITTVNLPYQDGLGLTVSKNGIMIRQAGLIQVFSPSGQLIKTEKVTDGQFMPLRSGVYIVRAITTNGVFNQKIIL